MRRAHVVHHIHDPRTGEYRQIKAEYWLVQVLEDKYSKAKVILADDDGRLSSHAMDNVRIEVPRNIPLLHGAPRRGESVEISAPVLTDDPNFTTN